MLTLLPRNSDKISPERGIIDLLVKIKFNNVFAHDVLAFHAQVNSVKKMCTHHKRNSEE